jgi:hypothetical protein
MEPMAISHCIKDEQRAGLWHPFHIIRLGNGAELYHASLTRDISVDLLSH